MLRNKMKHWLKLLSGVLGGLICVIVGICVLAFLFLILIGQYEFEGKIESIKIGNPISVAVSKLGKPYEVSKFFRLGQRRGFEEEYERAESSNAESFHIWECCIDKTYTLGVDSNGIIVVSGYGGT